jgi:hypothetical protein
MPAHRLGADIKKYADYVDEPIDGDITWNGSHTFAKDITSTSTTGKGTAGTGVTASESKTAGGRFKTVLTLSDAAVTLADEAGVVAYGGLKIYDMPTGAISFLYADVDLALTKSSAGVDADWNGDFGIGTATASNNATLTLTEDNLVASTATPEATDGATTATGTSTADEHIVVDGTSSAVDVYLNILVDDADHDVTSTACNIIANGTITLVWENYGSI